MVRCAKGLRMRPERPRARGLKRFRIIALPTKAAATTRSSTSRLWLFSALAIALSRVFLTSKALRLRENSRSSRAFSTFLPRINCAKRFSFCGLTRNIRATALASLSFSARGAFSLAMTQSLSASFGFLIPCVTVKGPGRRKLTEFMADHIFGHGDRHMLVTVIDREREPDELRQYGRPATPNLDDFGAARIARTLRLLEQIAIDERALPNRARHDQSFF